MKIAVPCENGMVFARFGHAPSFAFYTVEDGTVTAEEVLPSPGEGHAVLTGFLSENGADTLICDCIGIPAREALALHGIRLFAGVNGGADAAVEALLSGGPLPRTGPESTGAGACGTHRCDGN